MKSKSLKKCKAYLKGLIENFTKNNSCIEDKLSLAALKIDKYLLSITEAKTELEQMKNDSSFKLSSELLNKDIARAADMISCMEDCISEYKPYLEKNNLVIQECQAELALIKSLKL